MEPQISRISQISNAKVIARVFAPTGRKQQYVAPIQRATQAERGGQIR
jgi:hypothetical protein